MFKNLSVTIVVVSAVMGGCGRTEEANYGGFKQGRSLHNSTVREAFDYMADNSMWSNMAISDVHFVAHTAELSGAGAGRLDRMAYMLNAYGGTLRYETYATDEHLVLTRLKHVREYLALAGCDTRRVRVESTVSGGALTPASDAIRIYQEGTVQDESSGGESASGAAQGGAATN